MLLIRRLLLLFAAVLLVLGGDAMVVQGPGSMVHAVPMHHAQTGAMDQEDCPTHDKMQQSLCCVAACAPLALMPAAIGVGVVEWHPAAVPEASSHPLQGRSISPHHRPPRRLA